MESILSVLFHNSIMVIITWAQEHFHKFCLWEMSLSFLWTIARLKWTEAKWRTVSFWKESPDLWWYGGAVVLIELANRMSGKASLMLKSIYICSHRDNTFSREGLACSIETMPNHILHLLQQHDFVVAESSCSRLWDLQIPVLYFYLHYKQCPNIFGIEAVDYFWWDQIFQHN